jgi:hypothetical protein
MNELMLTPRARGGRERDTGDERARRQRYPNHPKERGVIYRVRLEEMKLRLRAAKSIHVSAAAPAKAENAYAATTSAMNLRVVPRRPPLPKETQLSPAQRQAEWMIV